MKRVLLYNGGERRRRSEDWGSLHTFETNPPESPFYQGGREKKTILLQKKCPNRKRPYQMRFYETTR